MQIDTEKSTESAVAEAGLRSDGELVQAVSESSPGGAEIDFVEVSGGGTGDASDDDGLSDTIVLELDGDGAGDFFLRLDGIEGESASLDIEYEEYRVTYRPSQPPEAFDDTPHDSEVPKEFRDAEAPPPPFDADF